MSPDEAIWTARVDRVLDTIERRWARGLLALAWKSQRRVTEGEKRGPKNTCRWCRRPMARGSQHGRICRMEAARREHVRNL